ncbi:hypothetical protein HPB50_020547 [Hyalomma asiaticum]|uniref:Uncharacterized protein n=1 Tax=Hyalomma asiaticum TaxID=266040 RepID=A0ACB7TLH1_HYAAI|nr:hypothetical protein HPB50_020547 [Hyalomma asiaticum]
MGNGMNKVLPGVYIGNFRDSKDPEQLQANNITHIISIHDTARKLHEPCRYPSWQAGYAGGLPIFSCVAQSSSRALLHLVTSLLRFLQPAVPGHLCGGFAPASSPANTMSQPGLRCSRAFALGGWSFHSSSGPRPERGRSGSRSRLSAVSAGHSCQCTTRQPRWLLHANRSHASHVPGSLLLLSDELQAGWQHQLCSPPPPLLRDC